MKRQLLIACLAALCASTVLSCNKDAEEDYLVDPLQDREVLLTASLADGPDTRAVSVSGDAVSCSWNVDDKLALVYGGEIISELTVSSISGNRAALSGKVKGAYPEGTEFTLYYGGTDYNYASQSGTQADASRRAYLSSTATIARQDNKTLQLGPVSLGHRQAYFELSFQYGPDLLKVKKVEVTGSDCLVKRRPLAGNPEYFTAAEPFTVTAASDQGADIMYFALCDESTADVTYVFKVTDINGVTYEKEYKIDGLTVSNPYLYKTGTAQNGSYHSGNWVLDQKSAVSEAPVAIQTTVYDGNAHALVTPGRLPEGTVGAVIEYYTAPRLPLSATPGIYPFTDFAQLQPNAGSTWSTTVPEGTDPGEYYIWYRVRGGLYFKNDPEDAEAFVIGKQVDSNPARILRRTLAVTAPAAVANLKYTGSSQALVTAGSLKDELNGSLTDCVLQYYVDSVAIGASAPAAPEATATGWSTKVPRGIGAKDYYVWYKVDGGDYYYEVAVTPVSSVAIRIVTTDAVVANPVPIENLVYNGEEQQLVLPADASDGCKVYYHVHESDVDRSVIEAMNASDDWSEDVPMRKNAGTYYIWTKIVEEGHTNYSGVPGVSAAAVVTSIAKADLTVQVPTLKNWTYDGAQHNLVNDTLRVRFTGVNGTVDALKEEVPAVLSFKVNDGSWTAYDPAAPVLPSATNAGTYAVSYKVDGGRNFKSINATSIGNAEVSKATITVSVAPAKVDNWDYDGTAHALIDPTGTFSYAGASNTDPLDTSEPVPAVLSFQVNGGEWSTTVPTATNAGTYALKYKVEGGTNFVSIGATDLGSVVVNKANAVIDSAPQGATGLTYNSLDKHLLSAAGVTSISTIADNHTPVMWYKVADSQPATPADNGFTAAGWSNNYLADALVGTDAGTYKIWYAVQGASNYNGVAVSSSSYVEVEIESSSATVTKPVGAENLVYSASAQELLTSAGSGEGTVYYFVTTTPDYDITGTTPISNPSDWYTDYQDIKGTDSGTYYVWVYAGGNTNYSAAYSDVAVEVVIAKAAGPAADISYSTVSPASSAIATDGGIGNLNDTGVWEYSTDDGTTWTDITSSSITGLAPIMVKIRVKETANYLAGAAQRIDVPQYYSVPEGAISGVFSVSESKKIFFSKGNLQYIGSASTPYWKFANHQYDYLGNNGQGSDSETVDRDFFGWGTGNAPNKVSTASDQYTVFTDWGTNAISNGGNTANFGWYTMSESEWGGIAGSSRYTFSGVRYAKATVAGVPGMIFFPDTWSRSYFDVTSFNNDTVGFTVNIITEDDWNNKFELNGAVFLPAAGIRNHTTVSKTGEWGYYWESNVASYQTSTACALWFYSNNMIIYNARPWSYGYSVRLAIAVPQSSSAGLDNYIVNTPQVW